MYVFFSCQSNNIFAFFGPLAGRFSRIYQHNFVFAPFERVFSKENKRLRYIGIAKNQFAEFMKGICFNLRRLVV